MKKITLVVVLIASTLIMNAQEFKVGMGGGIYSTWLVNKNVSDQGDDLDFAATFGGQIGLNMQYYFKDNLGLNFGLLFTGHNQKYTGDYGTTPSSGFEAKTKMRYLDIPFLLRMGGGAKGAYFEFGPQFGLLMSAQDEYTAEPTNPYLPNWSGIDRKDDFKGSNIAFVLGFGVDIDASENVLITTGLRLGYGLGDVTKEYKEAEVELKSSTFPPAIGASTYWAHIKQGDSGGDTFKYASTARAFGGLFVSVLFKIPSKK